MLNVICRKNIPGIEIVTPFPDRRITHAFHDIDGTHSRIRDWVPVMTLCNGYVSEYGMPETGSAAELAAQLATRSPEEFPEARRFAIESAGLSALTQMEWALRRAVQNGKFKIPGESAAVNDEIVKRIWAGQEEFPDLAEPEPVRQMLTETSSRLFQAYEILLCQMSRDRNLAAARLDPAAWRIDGSLEFLEFLQQHGVKNYFVTGAVIEYGADGIARGTMAEEVEALGLGARPGGIVERLVGSTWDEKLPKEVLMERICKQEQIAPENVLIVGDGRSEIGAAVNLGALAMSRLNADAVRPREIHRELGTNLIVERYDLSALKQIMQEC